MKSLAALSVLISFLTPAAFAQSAYWRADTCRGGFPLIDEGAETQGRYFVRVCNDPSSEPVCIKSDEGSAEISTKQLLSGSCEYFSSERSIALDRSVFASCTSACDGTKPATGSFDVWIAPDKNYDEKQWSLSGVGEILKIESRLFVKKKPIIAMICTDTGKDVFVRTYPSETDNADYEDSGLQKGRCRIYTARKRVELAATSKTGTQVPQFPTTGKYWIIQD